MGYRSWSVIYGEQPSASKWNILGTNDAHFYDFLGASNAVSSYTPTITNLTGANNTINGKYQVIGNLVRGFVKVTLGAGFGISGNLRVSVPFSTRIAYSTSSRGGVAMCRFVDNGTATYIGYGRFESSTDILLLVMTTNGTYSGGSGLSTSIPHAWASTDWFEVEYYYERASV